MGETGTQSPGGRVDWTYALFWGPVAEKKQRERGREGKGEGKKESTIHKDSSGVISPLVNSRVSTGLKAAIYGTTPGRHLLGGKEQHSEIPFALLGRLFYNS